MEYSRQNKLKGLAESYYNSSSIACGMKKVFEDWSGHLGKWRYFIVVLSVVALFLFFYVVYVFGNK